MNKTKIFTIAKVLQFLKISDVSSEDLAAMVEEYKESGTFSDQEKADSLAKELSEKLMLNHSASEWMNSLIHFLNL